MPVGPGKYDDVATYVRETTEAETAIILVFDGNKGTGFSMQSTNKKMLKRLPTALRMLAFEIEKETAEANL